MFVFFYVRFWKRALNKTGEPILRNYAFCKGFVDNLYVFFFKDMYVTYGEIYPNTFCLGPYSLNLSKILSRSFPPVLTKLQSLFLLAAVPTKFRVMIHFLFFYYLTHIWSKYALILNVIKFVPIVLVEDHVLWSPYRDRRCIQFRGRRGPQMDISAKISTSFFKYYIPFCIQCTHKNVKIKIIKCWDKINLTQFYNSI